MRRSAFRGNWIPNKRPYVTLTPDVFVAIQGETSVIGCGECRREININDYVTGISTEASIDSAPGSATINLSVPDTDVNNFYVDGQLVIIPMMEVEIYAKGYFLIGGFPQYYRIFWGLVSSVSKSWSGGTTTISINCKDILRWWELTMVTINPAYTESFGGSAGGYQLWQNQFAAMNPATIIIKLAREAMGDFSLIAGSFQSFQPEKGPEGPVIGSYAKDVMAYWQLKFANIWNNLVIYGSSGEAYTFTGDGDTISPVNISAAMFNNEQKLANDNQATSLFKIQPNEITPFKQELNRAGDVELFQTEQMSKLSIAQACRDQSGWEFYCDPSGDIVFKPPFYNLNVLPNKPVSWIQDYEIIDDSINDSESEVFTHITSSGNAFGGVMDWGLTDEITAPRTGVVDYHLLRRYGWRRLDYQCEWAGNPKKLFYWLIDYLDRINAKRQSGTVTIPMRPELKLGFPIWFPKYDSFFYVSGISHQFSVGGQATTTLTLIAKRSKFIAPNNIGTIKKTKNTRSELVRNYLVPWKEGEPKNKVVNGQKAWVPVEIPTYEISFPNHLGDTAGLSNEETMGQAVIIRDPKTGKLLGFPNVVMVYRSTVSGTVLSRLLEERGSKKAKNPKGQDKQKTDVGSEWTYQYTVAGTFARLRGEERAKTISKLRAHRYEAGMTNGGAYDYAHDVDGVIKEMLLLPTDTVTWNVAGESPDIALSVSTDKQKINALKLEIDKQTKIRDEAKKKVNDKVKAIAKLEKELMALLKKAPTVPKTKATPVLTPENPSASAPGAPTPAETSEEPQDIVDKRAEIAVAKKELESLQKDLEKQNTLLAATKNNQGNVRALPNLNVLVRPVSDEFGFEVIGHNRYGRGAFIDRGKLQLPGSAPGETINRINIQFAPTGGLLTDPGIVGVNDGSSVDFAASFERMQPDDYLTGASFSGGNKPSDIVDFQFTSQETYTNLINKNVGKSLYIEADATRKAKTLGELKPTVAIGGLDGLSNCSCGLGNANWLGLLPVGIVEEILRAEQAANPESLPVMSGGESGSTSQHNPMVPTTLSIEHEKLNKSIEQVFPGQDLQSAFTGQNAIIGNPLTTSGFFSALTKYLQETIGKDYAANAEREAQANASSRNVVSQLFDAEEETNILGDSQQDPLFARAASGDPEAFETLQNNIANSNFGMSKKAMDTFKKAWSDGKEKLKGTWKTFGKGKVGPMFEVTSGDPAAAEAEKKAKDAAFEIAAKVKSPLPGQVQPHVPTPNLASLIINPSSPTAKNRALIDAKFASDVAGIAKTTTPGDPDVVSPTKPVFKKPGSP